MSVPVLLLFWCLSVDDGVAAAGALLDPLLAGVAVILSLLMVSGWSVANWLCLDKQQEPTEHKLSRVNLMVVCAVEMGMMSQVLVLTAS